VISPALKMINKNTSLKADWKVTDKTGKRITHIKFNVFESDQLNLTL
jgi:plasmid replication initiation protein